MPSTPLCFFPSFPSLLHSISNGLGDVCAAEARKQLSSRPWMACASLEELLKASLAAAEGAGDSTCVAPGEKAFEVCPGLYLATEFGAQERGLLERMGLAMNLTGGA